MLTDWLTTFSNDQAEFSVPPWTENSLGPSFRAGGSSHPQTPPPLLAFFPSPTPFPSLFSSPQFLPCSRVQNGGRSFVIAVFESFPPQNRLLPTPRPPPLLAFFPSPTPFPSLFSSPQFLPCSRVQNGGRSFVIAVFESFPPQNRLLCRL